MRLRVASAVLGMPEMRKVTSMVGGTSDSSSSNRVELELVAGTGRRAQRIEVPPRRGEIMGGRSLIL